MNREPNRRPNCATGVCGGHLPVPSIPKGIFYRGQYREKQKDKKIDSVCVSLRGVINVAWALEHGKKDNRRIKVCLA